MKKTLLFAAAVAALSANAETITYDFNTFPLFCEQVFSEEPVCANGEEGMAWATNYDFVDKTGKALNTCGSMFNEKDADGVWHAVKNRCISLTDGLTYTLEGEDGDFTPMDMTQPFICWDQEGVGPSRTLLMKGWGSLDGFVDENYNAIDEANWVATKHAISMQRNANTGNRTGTYVQLPAYSNPTALTIYIGHAGGNYVEKGLYALVTPIVDGEVLAPIEITVPEPVTAKRMYKVDVPLTGLTGNVAFRIGNGGSELHLYHLVLEAAGSASLDNIIANETVENAPVYNVLGQRVNENYKGLVIKNGKKFIQK